MAPKEEGLLVQGVPRRKSFYFKTEKTLVVMAFNLLAFLLLEAMPGAPSSVLAPSSTARLFLVAMPFVPNSKSA